MGGGEAWGGLGAWTWVASMSSSRESSTLLRTFQTVEFTWADETGTMFSSLTVGVGSTVPHFGSRCCSVVGLPVWVVLALCEMCLSVLDGGLVVRIVASSRASTLVQLSEMGPMSSIGSFATVLLKETSPRESGT